MVEKVEVEENEEMEEDEDKDEECTSLAAYVENGQSVSSL